MFSLRFMLFPTLKKKSGGVDFFKTKKNIEKCPSSLTG